MREREMISRRAIAPALYPAGLGRRDRTSPTSVAPHAHNHVRPAHGDTSRVCCGSSRRSIRGMHDNVSSSLREKEKVQKTAYNGREAVRSEVDANDSCRPCTTAGN